VLSPRRSAGTSSPVTGLPCEESCGLLQDLAFFFQVPDLATQRAQLVTFHSVSPSARRPSSRSACRAQFHQALTRDPQIGGDLPRGLAGHAQQAYGLSTELRRVRRMTWRQRGLPSRAARPQASRCPRTRGNFTRPRGHRLATRWRRQRPGPRGQRSVASGPGRRRRSRSCGDLLPGLLALAGDRDHVAMELHRVWGGHAADPSTKDLVVVGKVSSEKFSSIHDSCIVCYVGLQQALAAHAHLKFTHVQERSSSRNGRYHAYHFDRSS
jgi:hypothetical protein